ncbi:MULTISPECIES: hypothetical protein [Pseudomonas syringae group]|uniref:Uncharacterized protein n=3 Tax=Pseudomonas syringae group TaxID=136849 RepID=A0AAD0M792_9PSED|nr:MULTISPECIES: hypothetical protein [Pseudomonas syringae group]AVB23477.1 hypothetical protein BKM03_31165 [Pseudomonas avellanae]PHN34517.1 hypothetical protein AO261_26580 [Pseudomonas avellanae]POC81846.1 hypothetical protein BKM08_27680 [Pseudomonas amygdali pv. morsprunorum]POC82051.1 hypothetical protein BKM26_27570 [Pseudomonas avellanae]POP74916.1 hypothetical protein CXB34_28295 [Pseudomonas amygdali pv. morsprunorum]
MTEHGNHSAETFAALDEAVRLLDGDTREQTLPAPSPEALEFSKEVFTESLVAVMDPSSDWFSICALDKVVQAHKALTTTESGSHRIEESKSETQLYTALRMLHCVNYKKLDQDIRTKLPGVVLEYLSLCGLDDERGKELCGNVGWDRVQHTYSSFRDKLNMADNQASLDQIDDDKDESDITINGHKSNSKKGLYFLVIGCLVLVIMLYNFFK